MTAYKAIPRRENRGADDRGRFARSPWQMPASGWKDIALRTWRESSKDNVGLVAAGVAFYGFLALVPLLGAIVIIYGFVADPATVIEHARSLHSFLPRDVAGLATEMLLNVVQSSGGKKGLGLLIALAVALWGAKNAAGSIITALNIAYEEEEKRGFLKVTLMALLMTLAAVGIALLAIAATAVLGALHRFFPETGPGAIMFWKVLTYVLLAAGATAAVATLYRYGPAREKAKWTWITPGSLFASLAWLVLTLGFGFYVTNFGSYDKTYGSLGAVVMLLTWLYLSSYVLLFGAELNSEIEHQTAHDTTKGAPEPLGARGAWAADHVAGEGQGDDGSGTASAQQTDSGPQEIKAASQPPQHSGREFATSRMTAHAIAGSGGKVGLVSSALATAGLALLRQRGREAVGLGLLSGAVGLSLLQRAEGPR